MTGHERIKRLDAVCDCGVRLPDFARFTWVGRNRASRAWWRRTDWQQYYAKP
jgi:hypothetical protein